MNTIELENDISHLEATVKIHNFDDNPRGKGNLVRQHLFWAIKSEKMNIGEFNRRFAHILTYETLNNGIFDSDIKDIENLTKLKRALSLIKEVQSTTE